MSEEFYFFWDGICSQWHPSIFEINGMVFNCCEQWMMWNKAKLFGDEEIAAKVMATSSPREQKALGKQVKGFNKEEWEKVCKDIVFKGNYAKFTQNRFLLNELMETGDKTIVEASPYDVIWGIGMGEDDPDRFDKTKWRGTNWLGEVCMQVRQKLKEEAWKDKI